jgi:hypothetical protein
MIQTISFIHFIDSNNILKGLMHIVRLTIEIWKLHCVYGYCWTFTIHHHNKLLFTIKMTQQTTNNNNMMMIERGERKTKELDTIALYYLFYITIPLLGVLYYYYCWNLNMYQFINKFACFVVIAPQLYINYQMNMVNHISLNTMIYKSINIGIGKVMT